MSLSPKLAARLTVLTMVGESIKSITEDDNTDQAVRDAARELLQENRKDRAALIKLSATEPQ